MVTLNVLQVLRSLSILVLVMLAAHVFLSLLPYESWSLARLRAFVHVDSERSFPTYLASLLLSLCGFVALWIGRLERSPFPGWSGLGLLFLLAGIDEIAALHESLSPAVRSALEVGESGWLRFAWIIPAALVLLLLFVLFLRFALSLSAATRGRFALAAAIFLAGGLLLELPGGYLNVTYGLGSLPYILVSTLEEGLEFAGVLLFLWALIAYLRALADPPALRLG